MQGRCAGAVGPHLHPRGRFVTLDRPLARLYVKKRELLLLFDQPQIPLHTNGSENGIYYQVTRRKVGAGHK